MKLNHSQFKTLCLLTGIWMYCDMVATVAKTCGVLGVIAVGFSTFLVAALATM